MIRNRKSLICFFPGVGDICIAYFVRREVFRYGIFCSIALGFVWKRALRLSSILGHSWPPNGLLVEGKNAAIARVGFFWGERGTYLIIIIVPSWTKELSGTLINFHTKSSITLPRLHIQ